MLPAKLVERLNALTRDPPRGAAGRASGPGVVHFADLEMDLITYRVRRGGRDIHLSPIEFKILRHLLQHPEQVSTREELKNAAKSEEHTSELQSLMRSSYAVFCLKKKNKKQQNLD